MAVLKLTEPYSVTYARQCVKDSLAYHGEESILLRLFHPEIDDVGRCPRCSQDVYQDGESMCPVCYGTNLYDFKNQIGGVKEAYRAWALYTDHIVTEQYLNRGVVAPDQRQVQTEAFPLLVQNDVIVRIKRWNTTTHTALSEGEFYRISGVTRNSLRTGAHFGQTRDDVIGQSAQISWMPETSGIGITQYPIQNVTFPEFTIVGTQRPQAIGQPDKNVIYVPVPSDIPPIGTGTVVGASMEWNAVFTFTQRNAVNPWTITHSLDHDPVVTPIINGEAVDANITYPDQTTVTITFDTPQSGYAELV